MFVTRATRLQVLEAAVSAGICTNHALHHLIPLIITNCLAQEYLHTLQPPGPGVELLGSRPQKDIGIVILVLSFPSVPNSRFENTPQTKHLQSCFNACVVKFKFRTEQLKTLELTLVI